MTILRQRMTEDMQVRNLSPHTQASYLQQVSLFARHFGKSPGALGPEHIRAYQLYLTNEKKLAPGSIHIAVAALRFLYKVTLKKDWTFEDVLPLPKKPQKLPVVLSPEEVVHFLGCVAAGKHRVILTTCYAAGLRVSEAVRLKAAAIDNRRMVIRVEQGKGRKDRYVMLSPKLLDTLRSYWKAVRPKDCCSRAVTRANRSRERLSKTLVKRHIGAPTSPRQSRRIRCATPSRYICSNPAPICAPFSCCLVIVASPPRPGTCGSQPARFVRHPAHSTCCRTRFLKTRSRPRPNTSECGYGGPLRAGSGGCVPPLRRSLSSAP